MLGAMQVGLKDVGVVVTVGLNGLAFYIGLNSVWA